jgi:hypothetical protein
MSNQSYSAMTENAIANAIAQKAVAVASEEGDKSAVEYARATPQHSLRV